MSELIDTTEMYLRTIYELQEEGVPPLRARIAERLRQSGPTVSQTVARMERDGLLTVTSERLLELTPEGSGLATQVMRRHRLAERLLTDVIGLDPALVHAEACRWEHVISTEVERRLVKLLDSPVESPYGNPIPALEELGAAPAASFLEAVRPLSAALPPSGPVSVTVRRMGEFLQGDAHLLALLTQAEIGPGAVVRAERGAGRLLLRTDAADLSVEPQVADHLFVALDDPAA